MSRFSLSWLKREWEELRKDRHAFASALDLLKMRLLESNDTEIPRQPLLHEWSGSRSVVGSLEMSLHSIERSMEEIGQVILAIENGDVLDIDDTSKEESAGGN